MVIASCVTCTDPVLSQAVAKGPFADKFVPRPVREIISAEAASNDGFGFPFLMLATYLIRHANNPTLVQAQAELGKDTLAHRAVNLVARAGDVGRLGGGPGVALRHWLLETWLYFVALSILYGIVVGYSSCWAIKYSLRRCADNVSLLPSSLTFFQKVDRYGKLLTLPHCSWCKSSYNIALQC